MRLARASVQLLILLFLVALASFVVPLCPSSLARGLPASSNALLTEWTVPTPQSGPSALALDETGHCCWFLEYYGNKIVHLDANSGTFQEWPFPVAHANPFDLAVTTVGGMTVVWGTEIGLDRVFAFWPETGILREYNLPHSGTGAGYVSIEPTTSSQTRVWFTETTANRNGELIYNPTTSNVTLYEDNFPTAVGGGALGVYATPDSIWFAGFSALVRWDRSSQQYTMYRLPTHGVAIGRSISVDSQGNVWYTQGVENGTSNDNYVGVLRGGSFMEEWRVPMTGADPGSISINPITHQPWLIEQSRQVGNGAVAVLDNATGAGIFSATVSTAPSGGGPVILGATPETLSLTTTTAGPVTTPLSGSWDGPFTEFSLVSGSQPNDLIVDSAGNVWIAEPGSNRIARISEPSADFAVDVTPSVLTLSLGSTGAAVLYGISVSSFAGPVTLAATGLPTGVSVAAFNPPVLNIPLGGNATSNLVIDVSASATNGTTLVLIHASNGTLDHTASIILTISGAAASSTSQCLIAAAVAGSQLNPEAQSLRAFRDQQVESTKVGNAFMIVFNSWYYSFSPYVAHYIANRTLLRSGLGILLYPLIEFLRLASAAYGSFAFYPEIAVLAVGLLTGSMIGAFFIGLPVGLLRRRFHRATRASRLRLMTGFSLVFSLSTVLAGLGLNSEPVLMFSTSLAVLSSIFESALLTADLLSGDWGKLICFYILIAATRPLGNSSAKVPKELEK